MVIQIVNGNDYIEQIKYLDQNYFDWPWSTKQWSELNEDYLLCAALVDDVVVGFILFHITLDCAHLLKIYVKEQNQRFGIAQKMLDYSIKKFAQSSIYLEVSQENDKALNFYEKNGFERLVLKKNFYADGSNAWAMSKILK